MTEPPAAQTILIVEDDSTVAQLIRLYLVRDGYEVAVAADGPEGVRLARERRPDLVLLDLNLPGMDGVEVCATLRAESDVPVIMVTARVSEDDRLAGLDLGADDYITKPFSPRELAARVRAVLRRSSRERTRQQEANGRLVSGDIEVNLHSRQVRVQGASISLTPTEYRLLTYFIESQSRALTREQIIQGAFGYDFDGFDRTVDTHISNLRRKIEAAGGGRRLKTVYGVGYRFEAPEPV
jgi:DNA-binding response OmpR family regulator